MHEFHLGHYRHLLEWPDSLTEVLRFILITDSSCRPYRVLWERPKLKNKMRCPVFIQYGVLSVPYLMFDTPPRRRHNSDFILREDPVFHQIASGKHRLEGTTNTFLKFYNARNYQLAALLKNIER